MRNVPCPSGRALPSLRSRVATPSTCRSPGLSQPCRTGRQECEDRRRLVTLGIAARYDPVLVAGCGVPEHCGPHCGSAVCAILLLTGGYITYPKSNNEVRIVSLATHKTASCQGARVAMRRTP